MEEKVFPQPAVAALLETRMIEARLHTDGRKNIERIRELQKRLTGSGALPYYVIVDPATEQELRESFGISFPERFSRFLRGEPSE